MLDMTCQCEYRITLTFWCGSSISCAHVIVLEFREMSNVAYIGNLGLPKHLSFGPLLKMCILSYSEAQERQSSCHHPVLERSSPWVSSSEAENSKITAAFPSRQWPPPSALGPQHLRGLRAPNEANVSKGTPATHGSHWFLWLLQYLETLCPSENRKTQIQVVALDRPWLRKHAVHCRNFVALSSREDI